MATQRLDKSDISDVTLLAPVNLQPGVVTYCKAFDTKRGDVSGFHLQYEDSVILDARIEGSGHPLATASGSAQDPDTYQSQGGHGEPKYWFEYNFDVAVTGNVLTAISGTDGSLAEGCILYPLSGVGASKVRLKLMPSTSGTVSVYGNLKAHIY